MRDIRYPDLTTDRVAAITEACETLTTILREAGVRLDAVDMTATSLHDGQVWTLLVDTDETGVYVEPTTV